MSHTNAISSLWVATTIGALGKLHCGQSPASSAVNTSGNGVAYVTGPEQWDGYRIIESKWTTDPRRIAPASSIFITVKGSVGEIFPGSAAAIGRDIYAFEPANEMSIKFVFYALQFSVQDVVKKARGDIPGLTKEHILDHPISVPGPNQQAAIASKLDELFSRIDEGERALERVQKLVKRYRQSVLKAAVTGELTREWREKNKHKLESGDALLARILKARREDWEKAELEKMKAKGIKPGNDEWKRKYQEPSPPNTTDLPELPEGWVWSSLGQLFRVSVGSTPSRKHSEYWGGTIPWASSGEVAFCRIATTQESITELGFQNSSVKMRPKGTVLLAMIGEGKTRGQAAILDIEACHNQNAASIGVSATPIPPEYVYRFLQYRYESVRAISQGGNQPALNSDLVKDIAIPVPPLAEMTEMCDAIEYQLSALAYVEIDLAAQRPRIQAQRHAVLKEAFAGSLIPQDSGDEPATSLLSRIASERGTKSSVPRSNHKKTEIV